MGRPMTPRRRGSSVCSGMKLGKRQLELLLTLGTPARIMLTPSGEVGASLARRGLVSEKHGTRITPAGMRALADAFEAGELNQFMQHPWQAGFNEPGATSSARINRRA